MRRHIVHKARPSWWKFFWLFTMGWLIIPIFIAVWERYSVLLIITSRQVILETGILNRESREIFISDIRTVDVEQSFIQRMLGYGSIKFASAGTDRYELSVEGIKNPYYIKDVVNSLRRRQPPSHD